MSKNVRVLYIFFLLLIRCSQSLLSDTYAWWYCYIFFSVQRLFVRWAQSHLCDLATKSIALFVHRRRLWRQFREWAHFSHIWRLKLGECTKKKTFKVLSGSSFLSNVDETTFRVARRWRRWCRRAYRRNDSLAWSVHIVSRAFVCDIDVNAVTVYIYECVLYRLHDHYNEIKCLMDAKCAGLTLKFWRAFRMFAPTKLNKVFKCKKADMFFVRLNFFAICTNIFFGIIRCAYGIRRWTSERVVVRSKNATSHFDVHLYLFDLLFVTLKIIITSKASDDL